MPGQVIDLNEWKAENPPMVRCANAMIRCWWNWALLPAHLAAKAWGFDGKIAPQLFQDNAVTRVSACQDSDCCGANLLLCD